jgi:biopolymer transport protein ExbD
MRIFVLLVVGMCLFLGGVRGEEELVFVEDAPKFELGGTAYVKVVWKEGVWGIFEKGELYAQGRTDAEINKVFKELREKEEGARFVIVAGGEVTLGDIKKVMRGAAKAGFLRVDFLVRSGEEKGANHSFHVNLPDEDEVERQYQIEPLFIRLDAKGGVFNGSGPHSTLLDNDLADHAMPKLGEHLKLYSAAARAAGHVALCHVYGEDSVGYERVVHLMALIHKHQITEIEIVVGSNFQRVARIEKLPIKP